MEDNTTVRGTDSIVADPVTGEGKPSYIKDTVKLDSVTVKSDHSAEERVTAKAGSAGGVSVSPVLALNISGMRSEAYIGNVDLANCSQWQIRNDLTVSSDSVIDRQVAADAAAAGGSVGVGAAPVITVYNDSSRSGLRRSVKANNIKVFAEGISKLKSTARAGSNGAQSNSSDKGSGGESGGSSGDDSGESALGKKEKRTNRQTRVLAEHLRLQEKPATVI